MSTAPSLEPLPGPLLRPKTSRYPTRLLAELLAQNEEMIEQLYLERLANVGPTEILTNLIDQHKATAGLLRLQLTSAPRVKVIS